MEKRPFASAERLEDVVAEYPTPLQVYDERTIRSRVRALLDAFSWNQGFREYFAVKATPTPAILRLLADMGCGCDCATSTELVMAEACGVSGRRVMLSSSDTPDETYRIAHGMGAIVNLDGLDMVDCLERSLGCLPETVCCRLNPGGTFESANGIIGNPSESKFGMTEDQVWEAFRRLREKGVREFGLHAFLASNTQTNDYYPRLARLLFSLAVRLHEELDVHVGFVDLSGGIGVAYRPEDVPCDIAAIGSGVRDAYEQVLVPAGMGDVAVFTELGRWLLAPSGALLTRVLHEKVTYRDYLGVDACAADLMRPAMYDAYHHVSVVGREGEPASRRYNVVGGLCENNDQFARDRDLPETHVGDLLFIHDTGAHGRSMGYNYNGRLRPAEVLLCEDGSTRLIRRAESLDDYLATLDVDAEFVSACERLKS